MTEQVNVATGRVYRTLDELLVCPDHGEFEPGETRALVALDGTLEMLEHDVPNCPLSTCERRPVPAAGMLRWLRGVGAAFDSDQFAVGDTTESIELEQSIREDLEHADRIVDDVFAGLGDDAMRNNDVAHATLVAAVFRELRKGR